MDRGTERVPPSDDDASEYAETRGSDHDDVGSNGDAAAGPGRPTPPDWFVPFFERHYSDLVGAALSVGALDEHEAKDAVRDVMVRLIVNANRDLHNPLAYTRKAVARRVLDFHQARKRRPTSGLDDVGERFLAIDERDTNVWDDEQWVKGLLGALPPRQEEVMRHICEGLTCEEIAGLLGRNPGTIRSNLRHARQRLAAHIADARQSDPGGSAPHTGREDV